jgi:hypothetical protein
MNAVIGQAAPAVTQLNTSQHSPALQAGLQRLKLPPPAPPKPPKPPAPPAPPAPPPAPPTQAPASASQVWLPWQLMQLTPLRPHCAVVWGVTHTVPLQQPSGQEVASHAPPAHK